MSDAPGIHIHRPTGAAGAAVFSSPHSGRVYPAEMLARSRLDARQLRRSEDAFVDELFAAAPGFGAPLLRADAPRAWVDLNRGPEELDPALIEGVRCRRPEVILGDRFGVSCAPWLTALAEQAFTEAGFRVLRNAPFAGGYITQRYGRPGRGVHALQIELDRGLYLDEKRLERSSRFASVQAALRPVIAALAGAAHSADALAAE